MAPFGQPNINRFSLEAPLLGIRPVITATLPAHAVTIPGEASCRLPYSTPTRPAARGPETELRRSHRFPCVRVWWCLRVGVASDLLLLACSRRATGRRRSWPSRCRAGGRTGQGAELGIAAHLLLVSTPHLQ
ncbi:hypothetical protein PVAP13_7KG224300 [Panicum virgatum]|uniref:Uncharacterized protein n=1 Tax=Panicum virgatum TaxID=38727 RepID=A0A8T0QDS2_PANVG|nr:hypothetical protein PVAP13_7KG224300 [Panicum virgatum]